MIRGAKNCCRQQFFEMAMNNSRLTDEELWARLVHLALQEHEATSDLIETLAEIDERGVYKKKQYVSLFELCVKKLRYSEAAAYRRIRAARAIRLVPAIAGMYRAGEFTLETIALLHPFLKDADAAELVERARGLTVTEVERLVAPRREEPPRKDVVRFGPPIPIQSQIGSLFAPRIEVPPAVERKPVAVASSAPAAAPSGAPPAAHLPASVRIAFTADEEFHALLRRVQAAMRHVYPDGRLDGIFRDALMLLLRKKTPYAFRAAKR